MKTIEEKAKAYANSVADNTSEVWHFMDEVYTALKEAYLAGARDALSGQWRKDDDTDGLQDGDQAIVAIQRMDNSIKYFYAAYFRNGKFYNDSDDEEIYFFNLWMRLPEPPKDESL